MLVYQQLRLRMLRILGLCYKEKKVANGNGKPTMIDRLAKAVNAVEPGRTIWVLIAQIDPDAIGAAIGMLEIISELRTDNSGQVKIVYCGKISHPQNRTILNRYSLSSQIIPLGDIEFQPKDIVVLVDSQLMNDPRLPDKLWKIRPSVVIDHHRGDPLEEEANEFYLVDEVGSASTLVVELSEMAKVPLSGKAQILLTMGIYNDTKALVDAGDRDRTAHGIVAKNVNAKDFAALINHSLPRSYYDTLAYALTHSRQSHSCLIMNAGRLSGNNSDDISTIAEYLSREDGITMVVVWGVVDDSVVRMSVRCSNVTIDLDHFLKSRFPGSGAKFTPGGHGMGGVNIPLNWGPWAVDDEGFQQAEVKFLEEAIVAKFTKE